MDEVIMNLLGQEDTLPFCLCFANEQWKHIYGPQSYSGPRARGYTYRQLYMNVEMHTLYLLKFFSHKNYIRIDNKPILYIYINDEEVHRYLDLIRKGLQTYGIDDMYIIANTSYHCTPRLSPDQIIQYADAYCPFMAHGHDPKLADKLKELPCIYGGLMGWDVRPRYHWLGSVTDKPPNIITKEVCKDLITMYYDTKSPQIYSLFAWNEWSEGAIIEPNTKYGEDLGYAIKKAREIVKTLITDSVKFTYGRDNIFIDITRKVYINCIDIIENNWSIRIEKGWKTRDAMFSDPLIGVHKFIKVTNKIGEEVLYDEDQELVVPIRTGLPV
jgi:hypothetical protein